MSINHVDIFLDGKEEIAISHTGSSYVIHLGGTAKLFFVGASFTLDDFITKLNENYTQMKARKEARNAREERNSGSTAANSATHKSLKT